MAGCGGTLGMGAVLLRSNARFARGLEKRRKLLKVENCPLPVYVAEGLPSPCLFGVLWPCVYVTPEAVARPDALRHVLAHELTHHAHKAHLWAAARSGRPADLLSCSTAMTGGKKSIQRRVARLVKRPETAKTALFVAVSILALCLVFVFARRALELLARRQMNR